MKRGKQGFNGESPWLVGDRVTVWDKMGTVIRIEPDPAWVLAFVVRCDDGTNIDAPTEAIQAIDGFFYAPADEKTVDGVNYRKVQSRYSLRSYYSHSGPGWDQKGILADKEWAIKNFGRTFSVKEAYEPRLLPEIPIFEWEEAA